MKGTSVRVKNLPRISGLLAVLAVVLYSCGGDGSSGGYGYGGTGMPATATVQLVACPVGGATEVSIVGAVAGFSPSSVTVPVNDTVKWNNVDAMQHTVTSTTVPLNGSFNATVTAGASACLKFTSGGTFNYHCSSHPSMPTGVVIVQ